MNADHVAIALAGVVLLAPNVLAFSANGLCPAHASQAAANWPEWLTEIKHDGFRVIARKEGKRVRLYSRPGNDLTRRFESLAPTEIGLAARSQIAELLDKGASFVRRLLPLKVRSSLFHSQHLWRVQGEP